MKLFRELIKMGLILCQVIPAIAFFDNGSQNDVGFGGDFFDTIMQTPDKDINVGFPCGSTHMQAQFKSNESDPFSLSAFSCATCKEIAKNLIDHNVPADYIECPTCSFKICFKDNALTLTRNLDDASTEKIIHRSEGNYLEVSKTTPNNMSLSKLEEELTTVTKMLLGDGAKSVLHYGMDEVGVAADLEKILSNLEQKVRLTFKLKKQTNISEQEFEKIIRRWQQERDHYLQQLFPTGYKTLHPSLLNRIGSKLWTAVKLGTVTVAGLAAFNLLADYLEANPPKICQNSNSK